MRLRESFLGLALCVAAAIARPAVASPPTVELDLTGGYSTQDVLAAASQLRVFGELDHGVRYYLEGAWAAASGPDTDAFGAAYPYEDGFYAMETYVEKNFTAGRYLGAVRVGRFRTPFGIYSRSDHSYTGFLRAPLIRYSDYYGLSSTWLEGGAYFSFGTPRLQLEGSLGAPQDPVHRRESGLDKVVRLQGYHGPIIVGASYIETQRPGDLGYPSSGRSYFHGVDARWMKSGVQVRGEWLKGRTFAGVSTEGYYVDLIVHKPFMGPVTAVFRYENLDYLAGPYSFDYRRFTAGARVRLSRSLTGQLNLIHQNDLAGAGNLGVDVALTYSFRR